MKGVLDDMIQNSSLIIQNRWDPRKKCCLDSITLFWSLCFGDSITQNSEWWGIKKKKQVSIVFNFGHPWFSGISVNRVHQWAPRPVLCPINTMLWPLELSAEHYAQFSEIFFSTKISPFSLPSLNLAPFSLPCWHSQRASSMAPQSMFEDWTRPEKWVRVWRTAPHRSSEPSLNLHRRVHLSVVVSIPLSPEPSCNIISQVQ